MHTNRPARFVVFLSLLTAVAVTACAPAAEAPPASASPAAPQAAAAARVPAPVLERIFPRSVLPGGTVQLHGSSFGEQTDGSSATVRGKAAEILSWSDAQLRVRVPRDTAPGEATVKVVAQGQASNDATLLVNDPFIVDRIHEIPCQGDSGLCSVYLPPQYDTEPSRRFPVVYQFQGRSYSHRMLPERPGAAAVFREYPFIIVFDWTLQEKEALPRLIKEIDAAYRTIPAPESRGVWLISASGNFGLGVASERTDLIGAVNGSHACLGSFSPEGARKLHIRLDIGTEDDTCGAQTQRAREQLTAHNIPHIYEEHPGAHDTAVMFGDGTIRGVLDFFAKVLRAS